LLAGTLLPAPPSSGQSDEGFKKERREKRRQVFEDSHRDTKGKVRMDLWKKGIQDAKKMKIAAGIRPEPAGKGKAAPLAAGGVIGVQWTQIGPQPLRITNAGEYIYMGTGPDSGEVTDIAIDPRNTSDQVVYIATDDGGIWKTTDGGSTWAPKTDYMPSLSMGAVALDPDNPSIVYAGTGNLFDMGGIFFKGVGLYKSIDMGETWANLNPDNMFDGIGINRIAVLAGSDVVLVATNQGLFRSINGGVNFGDNAPLYDDGDPILNGFISDLDVDTATPTTVYASVRNTGIFRSTDSGATFPDNLFNNPGAPASFAWIVFAQSVSPNNQTLYALIQRTDNGRRADLYRSDDTGANWVLPSNSAFDRSAENNGCQCPADQTLGVDPQDPARVYIGFQELYVSADWGVNFGTPAVSRDKIHWDHHALYFSPQAHWDPAPTRIWVGTDGGVHASVDGGANWANLNETIATQLIHHLDIGRNSTTNNAYSYAGTWDTGTNHRHPGFAGNDWHLNMNGDGTSVAVSQSDPLIVFAGRNGGFKKTVSGGLDNWTAGGGAGLPACGGLCSMELAVDPNNDDNVFAYTTANAATLYRSTDEGANFGAIETFSANISGSWVWSYATVKADSNTLWVGLTNRKVARTTNALAADPAFTEITPTGAPNQPVTGIAINPLNTQDVVVVYPGFCGGGCAAGNRTKHVFRTTDNGTTWTDISGTDGNPSGNLPDLPVHSAVFDPGTSPATIIVSTDAGVMRSANNGATWEVMGVGLPTVDSKQLALDPSASPSLLRIGTYGRSAFELTAATGPLLAVNADLGFGTVCLGERVTRIVQIFNVGSEDLHIASFFRASGSTDFQIISGPASPVTVAPGEEIDYTIEFEPTSVGDQNAVFQINSDDPFQPAKQLLASGTGAAQNITTWIADLGNFGNVCLGSFKDLTLRIGNNGCGTVTVSGISSNSPEFKVPNVVSFPIAIAAGTAVDVPIRFEPTSLGAKAAAITIASNDPDTPNVVVNVSGQAQPGDVAVSGSTEFGDVCAGTQAEKTISVCNVGKCTLNVLSASLGACVDFQIVNNPFPAPVSPDFCVPLTIRFTPTSAGPKQCTLTITTDDPDEPIVEIPVTANTPLASIDVPPDMSYLPEVVQTVGACTSAKPFPVSNTGTCNLNITNMTIGGPDGADYSFSGLPSMPIILEPGHVAGEGNLKAVFAPSVIDRDRLATLNVTYESDPVTHDTTLVSRNLCGEGVNTGARVLVRVAGVPPPVVSGIHLQRVVGNRNRPKVDSVDVVKNAPLQSVIPAPPCPPFQFHREYGTVSNPVLLLPGSYTVTATAIVGGKRKSQTVSFDVTTCDFNPTVVIDF
jgi:photosystem II stability/assembly factor-like uncharacterized protein